MSPFWAGVLTVIVVLMAVLAAMCASSAMRYRDEAKKALEDTGVLLGKFKTETLDPLSNDLIEVRQIAAEHKVRPIR